MRLTLNKIGDPRAEQDHAFLDKAFYETPEYKTIMEAPHRKIVVGRRGTGKSALFYRMISTLHADPHIRVISIEPTDDQMIGLRYFVSLFGSKQTILRAAANIAWQYALLMELLSLLCEYYKTKSSIDLISHIEAVKAWRRSGLSTIHRMVYSLNKFAEPAEAPEKRVANLSRSLNIDQLRNLVINVLPETHLSVFIVADRLDEGFEPCDDALAVVNGLVYALGTLATAVPETKTVIFIRDNILRSIQDTDPDYTRNTEGDVLRLHWDEYHLFNMACNRIRTAFSIDQEQNLRAWNAVTDRAIQGSDGFRRCLRLTLYRPRDLVLLLNRAFYNATAHNREQIIDDDIDTSAKDISLSRLSDLKREYEGVVPGLSDIVACFTNGSSQISFNEAIERLNVLFGSATLEPKAAQHLAILGKPEEVLRQLYSIGFLGIFHAAINSFVFSHDGKQPDFVMDQSSRILIHPCYWVAMNLHNGDIPQDQVQEIHDDYDIEVKSETPEIRNRRLGQIIGELDRIPLGTPGATLFEDWCLRSLRIVFAGAVVNLEHHPNRNSTQRRDIVGRNSGESATWKRILADHNVRQVVFEAKNFDGDLGPCEYRQMLSYMCGEHGNLCFIINRASSPDLLADRELAWCREIYHEHEHRIVVKLTAKLIVGWMSKLRSPQKHDAADKALGGLLDRYERMYLRLG